MTSKFHSVAVRLAAQLTHNGELANFSIKTIALNSFERPPILAAASSTNGTVPEINFRCTCCTQLYTLTLELVYPESNAHIAPILGDIVPLDLLVIPQGPPERRLPAEPVPSPIDEHNFDSPRRELREFFKEPLDFGKRKASPPPPPAPPPPTTMDERRPGIFLARIETPAPPPPVVKTPYFCELCNTYFGAKLNLRIHNQQHYGHYECFYCSATLKTKNKLLHHFSTVHGKGDPCPVCKKILPTFVMSSHLKQHEPKLRYCCAYCNMSIATKGALRIHLNLHSKIKKFICETCGEIFFDPSGLRNHLKKCPTNSGRTYRRRSKATNQPPYKCPDCPRICFTLDQVKAHKYYKHRKWTAEETTCTICGKRYQHRVTLKKHIERIHYENAPVKCLKCSACFKSEHQMKAHLKTMHHRDRCYNCDVCGRIFHRLEGYRKHYRIHTGEKPYSCPECELKFADRSSMNRHRKMLHIIHYIVPDEEEEMAQNQPPPSYQQAVEEKSLEENLNQS